MRGRGRRDQHHARSRGGPRTVPGVNLAPPLADIVDFFDAVDQFFSSLAGISWGALLIGLASFFVYLTLRSRAYFNVLRAAYPTERIEFRRIWGAYIAAYGFNNVVPARGGDLIRLFLTKSSVPELELPGGGLELRGRGGLRRDDGRVHPHLRVHPGRVPQAAGLLASSARSTSPTSPRTRGSRCS